MNITEARKLIQEFANEHKVVFEDDGECGIGRDCVGLLHGNNYVAYNPIKCDDTYDHIKDFYDERFHQMAPADAYHKHDCFAVLVHDEDYDTAIIQLGEWVVRLNEIGVELDSYSTGATGMQALLSGLMGTAFRMKNKIKAGK